MADKRLKKIAIVGASGNVGTTTLKHLLERNNEITITVITRADSTATFPSSSRIIVKKGSYQDDDFLLNAFAGNELAIMILSFTGTGLQPKLIDAAVKAAVKWIIPNEFGGDGENEALFQSNPLLHDKIAARKQIEHLAETQPGLKWIGVATNPWTELSINMGMFGINIPQRTLTLWSETGIFNSSSIEQVGRGIAALLSLPIANAENPRASLEHYGNKFVYISSYLVDQRRLFDAVKRATGTSDPDWKISHSSNAQRIESAKRKAADGDYRGNAELLYAYYMGEGLGGNYEAKAEEDRAVLGLKEENLDEVVQAAVLA